MAKDQRGTKRTDPETGKKFYDLNRDPVVSPFSGKSYPLSYFEQTAGKITAERAAKFEDDEEETEEEEVAEPGEPELVSLEEADAEEGAEGEDIPEVEGVEDVEDIGDDEDDVFLEEEDEPDEDIGFGSGGDDER